MTMDIALRLIVGLLAAACIASAAMAAAPTGPSASAPAKPRDYRFDGSISRKVLENYLSRSITMMGLLHESANLDEDLRMLRHTGAKLAGRAMYTWGRESRLEAILAKAGPAARKVHAADADIILQACAFEIVSTEVSTLAIPAWVFEEFGRPAEKRTFRYADMLYVDGWGHNRWRRGSSVPDMSRPETRMWFYWLARRWIDAGAEAIHFGQVRLMDRKDPKHVHWFDVLGRIRRYAARHARRHLLLADAHTPKGGVVEDGKCLLDFHSFPLRIDEVEDRPQEGVLRMGYIDSIYGRSTGGLAPSGWQCDHLPYLVELDNFDVSNHPGKPGHDCYIWGYDEICWYALQPEQYRNRWLRYAWDWLRQHDANGHLQMPGNRCLFVPVAGLRRYAANTKSPAAPNGFSQEETIRAIWAADK